MATSVANGNMRNAVLCNGNCNAGIVLAQLEQPLLDPHQTLRNAYDIENAIEGPSKDGSPQHVSTDTSVEPDNGLKLLCLSFGCATSLISEIILSNTLWKIGVKYVQEVSGGISGLETFELFLFSTLWAYLTCVMIFRGMRATIGFTWWVWFGGVKEMDRAIVVSLEFHFTLGALLAEAATWIWYSMGL